MQTALYILVALVACLAIVAFVLWLDLRKHPYDPNNDMPEG